MVAAAMLLSRQVAAQTPSASVIPLGDTTDMVLGSASNLPYVSSAAGYTQQLVLNTELEGAAMITGIDLYCGIINTGRAGCSIYLANTYVPDLGDGLVPFGATFQMVAVDSLACMHQGWNHYEFDTAFFYNGLGNLIVAFDCPWGFGGGHFYSEHIIRPLSRFTFSRLANVSPITTSDLTYYRNVMRLHTQPVSQVVTGCPAPTLWVDSAGATALRMRWSPGYQDTSWVVECVADGDTSWHGSSLVWGDTSYTLTGLTPNTHYTVRLTAFCTDTFTTVLRHVVTNCTPAVLPYSEGFEGQWDMPDCWLTMLGSRGDYPAVGTTPHSGIRSVWMKGGTVVLPAVDAEPDSVEISFFAYFSENPSYVPTADLYVGMVSDALDFSTFVPVDTVTLSRHAGWTPVVVRFDHYSGPWGRIALMCADTNRRGIYLDDIAVNRIVPCQTIMSVSVDQVTDTSAVVHWADSSAVYYEVACVPAGNAIDSSHIVTDIRTDSLLLTGLLDNTLYEVYVRSYCGSFNTNWSAVVSFLTLCSPLDTLPYTEDFDSYTGGTIRPMNLPCWHGSVAGDTYENYFPGGGHSGMRMLQWRSHWGSGTTDYIVLPAINTAINPMGTLLLSFWARNDEDLTAFYDDGRLLVGVMDDPDVDSTFQLIDTVSINSDEWQRYDIPLSSYSGSGRYITLKECTGMGTHGWSLMYIDDIEVDLIPPCTGVTGMRLTGLTASTVTVEWDDVDTGAAYQTFISPSSTALPVADSAVLDTSVCTFGGLTTGTSYYVWVRAICSKGGFSPWEGPLQVVPGVWNMRANHNDTLAMCGVTVYDNGGPNSTITAQNSTLVIMPAQPGTLITASGQITLPNEDMVFTVYDGVGTTGAVLWSSDGVSQFNYPFGPLVSNSGPLTLALTLYYNQTFYGDGFELNVSCIPDSCVVKNLRLDSAVPQSDTMLNITWDCNGATYYEVEYGPKGFVQGTGTLDTTSAASYTIAGLTSLARRDVYVRGICGAGANCDTSSWVRGTFITQPCPDAVYRENFNSSMNQVRDMVVPIGPNNTYSECYYVQTIVDSAFLAGLEGGITAMAFHPATPAVADRMSNMTVYLANVSDVEFSSGIIVPDSAHRFVKVIDSANFCYGLNTEWQVYGFDRPFLWNGHSNLLVSVLMRNPMAGDWYGTLAYYYAHTTSSLHKSYVVWDAPASFSIYNANTYTNTSWRAGTGDLRFYTNTCHMPFCAEPVVDTVAVDYESATLSWNGTGGGYQLTISPNTTGEGLVLENGTSHTFTGLMPATTYQVSIRQDCMADSLGYSDWITVEFTTDSFRCLAPDSFAVYDITRSSATFDWVGDIGGGASWQLEVWTPGSRHVSHLVTEHPFVIEDLNPGTTYCAYIHGYCGSANQITGEWSDTLCFTTPTCPDVTGFDTSAVTTTSVSLVWNADEQVQDYLLEYGPAGFALGSGIMQTVTADSCTVGGLTPSTAYDFYLRARCDEDWLSDEYAALLNVVTRQSVGVVIPESEDVPFSLTIVPNPAKGVTTLYLEGLPKQYRGVVEVTVSDLSGREVLTRRVECDGQCRLTLNLEDLLQGAYFVRVECGGGSQSPGWQAVRKLIVIGE